MITLYYVGRRRDSRGRVELSVRFRAGKIDRRVRTNIWIMAEAIEDKERLLASEFAECKSVSPDIVRAIRELTVFIEERYCMNRRGMHGAGWLADTVEMFHTGRMPEVRAEQQKVTALIDEFLDATATYQMSASREEAYRLVRRSASRFEALKQLRYPSYRFTATDLSEVRIREFERFMLSEHKEVALHPGISSGPGREGRTLPKSRNTVNDRMKLLKAVMRWAVRVRRIPRNPLDTYTSSQNVYGSPVYLTVDERHRLERFDLSRCPSLEVQRDIFIFQCCIGCRVSDLKGLTRSNVIDGELHYVARKTRDGRPVTIKVPLNSTALRILRRYSAREGEGLFPVMYTRSGYNSAIKLAMRRAGLSRRVMVLDPMSRQPRSRKLWEIASSQMARRTFIGNIYKRFKDQALVSELSGHSPGSRAFVRYREVDHEMKCEMVKAIE